MKEYRIICTEPNYAIVDVYKNGARYVGYTNISTAAEDLAKLVDKYRSMSFQIVDYVDLAIE